MKLRVAVRVMVSLALGSLGVGPTKVAVAADCPAATCPGSQFICSSCTWGSFKDDGCDPPGSGRRRWASVLWGIPWGQSWENTCGCTAGKPPGLSAARVPDRCCTTINEWGQWLVPDATCCPSGWSLCGTTCLDLRNDVTNCGTCGNHCPAGAVCCNGACRNLQTDPASCGRCGAACAPGQTCCNGRCASLGSDVQNCGSCGNACSGGRVCGNGACTCPSGYTLVCNNTCVNPNTDPANCGACGVTCSGGRVCQGGACACPPSATTVCAGICTNTSSDAQNCGTCGRICPAGQVCQNGACGCPAPLSLCAGVCVNTNTDQQNCGGCNRICPSGQQCCAGSCKDLSFDAQNCGRCGNVCVASCSGVRTCRSGACQSPSGFPVLVENAFSRCLLAVDQVGAFSTTEAVTCEQQRYPGSVAGVFQPPAGVFTYKAVCPNGYCFTISNIYALSTSDAAACVRYYYGGCTVTEGSCP